jgi:hypothetical protein
VRIFKTKRFQISDCQNPQVTVKRRPARSSLKEKSRNTIKSSAKNEFKGGIELHINNTGSSRKLKQ